MQNLARFQMTTEVDGEYLRNLMKYLKLDKYLIYRDFSCIRQKKFGELWSTNYGDLEARSYLPKASFLEDLTSALRGCCAPNFCMY